MRENKSGVFCKFVHKSIKIIEDMYEQELNTYYRHLDELRASNPLGGFVVIKGEEILDVWLNDLDALKEGLKAYGDVPFMIKNLDDKPIEVEKETTQKGYSQLSDEATGIISIEILNYCHAQLQKRMEDYHSQANSTTDKAYKQIAVYISILSILTSFIFYHQTFDIYTLSTSILALSTLFAIIIMMIIIMPRLYYPLGKTLDELQPNEYAKCFKDINEDEQYKWFLSNEICSLEVIIKKQGEYNNRRTRLFKTALVIMLAGIIIAAFTFLTAHLVSASSFQVQV